MYCSPSILKVITLRRMIWDWHVARMGGGGEAYTGLWWKNLRERIHFGDPAIEGR